MGLINTIANHVLEYLTGADIIRENSSQGLVQQTDLVLFRYAPLALEAMAAVDIMSQKSFIETLVAAEALRIARPILAGVKSYATTCYYYCTTNKGE